MRSRRVLLVGGVLLAAALALVLWLQYAPVEPARVLDVPAPVAEAPPRAAPSPSTRPRPAPAPGAPAPSPESTPAEAPVPESGPTGIALFPPRGTKRIKVGIIVPEGIELPPGYIRHYQTTDDGERLPAVLMFHPDYQPVDDAGNKVELPASRVVPEDLVPPGFPKPFKYLEPPPGQEPPD